MRNQPAIAQNKTQMSNLKSQKDLRRPQNQNNLAQLVVLVIILSLTSTVMAQESTPSAQVATSNVAVATDSTTVQPSPTPTSTLTPTPLPFEIQNLPKIATPEATPTSTQTPTPSLSPTLIPSLDRLYMPSAQLRIPIFLRPLAKKDYRADEAITAQVIISPDTTFTSELIYADASKENFQITTTKNADFITLAVEPNLELKPGKYTLKVTDSSGYESSQEFNWATVAINLDQSLYQIGQTAGITISTVDEKGTIVCDVEINFTIKGPDSEKVFSTSDGSVVKNPQCSPHSPTDKPDYQASYQIPNSPGTYNITLEANFTNQTNKTHETYHIEDSFEVKESVPFIIKRNIPTRAFTPNWQNNIISLTAQQDFNGEVKEHLPESLDIAPSLETTEQSYDKLEISQSIFKRGALLGTYIPALTVPFIATQSATLGFGENLKDPKLIRLYSQFGLAGHDGIDFDLPQGTTVVAADSGMVVLAGGGDYGITIVLQHDWGRSYYGHLSQVDVVFGQRVGKGEKIGLSGNTGLSTGAHLHFSIKPNKNDVKNGYYGKINPLPYLAQIPGQVEGAIIDNTSARVKQLSWNVSLQKGQTITLGYRVKLTQDSITSYLLGPISFYPWELANNPRESLIFIEDRLFQVLSDPPPTPPGASFEQSTESSFPMESIDPKLLDVPSDYLFVKAAFDKEIKGKYASLLLDSTNPSWQMSTASQNIPASSAAAASSSGEIQTTQNPQITPSQSGTLNALHVSFDYSGNDRSQSSKIPTSIKSNQVRWDNMFPSVDFSYDTYDGYINQKIILKDDSTQKDFAFNLDLVQNLEAVDYSGHVMIKDKNTQEEFFLLRFPQGIDGKNQRIDYKYKIEGNKLILYPNRAWQLQKAVYPITIYTPINVIAWNEIGVKVGEHCQESGCAKDGDIQSVEPSGTYWGIEEQKALIMKVDKMTKKGRKDLESKTDNPPEVEIPGTGETKIPDHIKNIPYMVGDLRRFGVDYTKLTTPNDLRMIRDKTKKGFSPVIDARSKKGVIKEKIKEDLLTSVIPKNRVYAYDPFKKSLLAKLWQKLVRPVQAVTIGSSSIGSATGRDYAGGSTGIQAWENAIDGNLVTADRIERGILYKDSTFTISATVAFGGSTLDSTHYIELTSAPSDRHDGKAGTGVILASAGGVQHGIDVDDTDIRLSWFEMTGFFNGASTTRSVFISYATASGSTGRIYVDNLIVHDFYDGENADTVGDFGIASSTTTTTQDEATIRNTIVYDGGNVGISTGDATDDFTVQNVTVFAMQDSGSGSDGGVGIYARNSSSIMRAQNSIAMNTLRDDILVRDVANAVNSFNMCEDNAADCAATSAGLTCSNCQTNKSTTGQFVSTTAGSEDFHLVSGSNAINNGTDLSANFTNDIDDGIRPQGTAWDIGADEFQMSLVDVEMRHGKYFLNNVEQAFRF